MLGVLSLSAIFAADRVLVPVSADYLAVKGAMQVDRTLNALQRVVGRRIERRYVITRFDGRRKMSWDILETFRGRFGADLAECRISENVSIAESPFSDRDVFAHAPVEPRRGRLRGALRGTRGQRVPGRAAAARASPSRPSPSRAVQPSPRRPSSAISEMTPSKSEASAGAALLQLARLEHLAMVVDLAQLALGLVAVASLDREVVDDGAAARADAEAELLHFHRHDGASRELVPGTPSTRRWPGAMLSFASRSRSAVRSPSSTTGW